MNWKFWKRASPEAQHIDPYSHVQLEPEQTQVLDIDYVLSWARSNHFHEFADKLVRDSVWLCPDTHLVPTPTEEWSYIEEADIQIYRFVHTKVRDFPATIRRSPKTTAAAILDLKELLRHNDEYWAVHPDLVW